MQNDTDDPDLAAYLASLDLEDAQVDAGPSRVEIVLDILLSKLSDPESRHYERYGPFISTEQKNLKQILLEAITPQLYAVFEDHSPENVLKPDHLSHLISASRLDYEKAVYGHILWLPALRHVSKQTHSQSEQTPTQSPISTPTKPEPKPKADTETPSKTYIYTGQAQSLQARLSQHRSFRYRRDNPSFHNFLMDLSEADHFVLLAHHSSPETERDDLVLNLLEMLCSLLLRTLQGCDLIAWLDDLYGQGNEDKKQRNGKYKVSWFPANVALPLDNADESQSRLSLSTLKESDDDLAREYYASVISKRRSIAVLTPIRRTPRRTIFSKTLEKEKGEKIVKDVVYVGGDVNRELVRGIWIGVFGTLGVFWIRHFVLGRQFSLGSIVRRWNTSMSQ